MWSSIFPSRNCQPVVPQKKDVVRVIAKKFDGYKQPETKRFSLDPDLTSFRILRDIISKAFHIEGLFVISYLVQAGDGKSSTSKRKAKFLPMLSDWDVNNAIDTAPGHYLLLKVDMKPFEQGLEDWDIIEPDDVYLLERRLVENDEENCGSSLSALTQQLPQVLTDLPWFKSSSADCGESQLCGNRGAASSHCTSSHSGALTDADLRRIMDADGRLLSQRRLRLAVFRSGVEPSLRPVVWRHLLNVYHDDNLTGQQRIAYTKELATKYEAMKLCWQQQLRSGMSTDELRLIANAVRKDVVRTDRSHPFFSGDDEKNKNILSLFNLLTTYSLAHPSVSYCQGMSDLASPLLIVMGDEAQAYVCFCALMRRLQRNFQCDGRSMTVKFRHLNELLQYYDPVFYEYLRETHAEDLLFCYRWLLLELKREFKFNDALLVMEVMWASMPPDPPPHALEMFEIDLTQCGDLPLSPPMCIAPSDRTLQMLGTMTSGGRSTSSRDSGDSDRELSNASSMSSLVDEDEPAKLMTTPCQIVARHSLPCDRTSESTIELIESVRSDESSVTLMPGRSLKTTVPIATNANRHDALSPVRSCPGNLNGLCHVAVVRSLMLGGKCCESKLHSGPTSTALVDNSACENRRPAGPRRIRDFGGTPDPNRSFGGHFSENVSGDVSPTSGDTLHVLLSLQEHGLLDSRMSVGKMSAVNDGESSNGVATETTSTIGGQDERQSVMTQEVDDTQEADDAPKQFGLALSPTKRRRRVTERHIRAQRELNVTDNGHANVCGVVASEAPNTPCHPECQISSVPSNEDSPVALASEASERDNDTNGELTLVDIYDMCVGQISESAPVTLSPQISTSARSRQTSGDPSSVTGAGAKTRHASQATTHRGSSTVPDSGYSGTTTPYRQCVEVLDTTVSAGGNTLEALVNPFQQTFPSNTTDVLSGGSPKPLDDGRLEVVNVEKDPSVVLPAPSELGDGNPFMTFISLALLLQHRDRIISAQMDFNEIAIYFDKLARKHSAASILRRARAIYADYLKADALLRPNTPQQ